MNLREFIMGTVPPSIETQREAEARVWSSLGKSGARWASGYSSPCCSPSKRRRKGERRKEDKGVRNTGRIKRRKGNKKMREEGKKSRLIAFFNNMVEMFFLWAGANCPGNITELRARGGWMLLTHMNWSKPVLTRLCTPSQSLMLLIDEPMNFSQSFQTKVWV